MNEEEQKPITAWLKREDGTLSEAGFAYMQLIEQARNRPEIVQEILGTCINIEDSGAEGGT
jgi:hypothetical protein